MFAALSLLAYAVTDLLGKRKVDVGTETTPVELLVAFGSFAFVAGGVLWICGLGESGLAPWTILAREPLLLVSVGCFVLYWLLCLISFRYLGLAVDAALGGMDGIIFFLGALGVHFLFGRMEGTRELLHPARLVPILIALSGALLLPRMEKSPTVRRRTVVGMLVLLLALVCDGGDTLVTAMLFDEGRIGPVDCMMASWFAALPAVVALVLGLRFWSGKWVVPFRQGWGTLGYAALAVGSSLSYLVASSHDAVRTGIVFVVAPVFTMIGARVVLGERYSVRQNFCIWMVAIAAIAFCVADAWLGKGK